jgi:phosphoserine phosphatase RsbU/P
MRLRFKAKLLLITLIVVLVPTFALVILFMGNFNSLTRFSLERNAAGIRQSNREFLASLAGDKASLMSLQFRRAADSVTVLGKAAQSLVDNYEELSAQQGIYSCKPFRDDLVPYKGALTSGAKSPVSVLIPPSIAGSPQARDRLKVSSLLNLVIGPAFESCENNIFLYFIGDRADPVTRGFPNISLASRLGDSLDSLFWKDFFQEDVPYWERFHEDEAFRSAVLASSGSPITSDPPYEDAAGQGRVLTLFYPLWDHRANAFAGVAAADISLQKIIQNVLAMRVAKTGYAILVNGAGEILAMSDYAAKDLKIETEVIQRNGLKYYYSSLLSSRDSGVKGLHDRLAGSASGYLTVPLDDGQAHVIVYSSLDPINNHRYEADTWKLVINVPERETLDNLFSTYNAITSMNARTTLVSLAIVGAIVAIVALFAVFVSDRVTRDIRQLALAAAKIARKDYDIDLRIKSRDEIGDLGGAFTQMSGEIREYTEHLEVVVHERTEKLEKALAEISELNARLQDEYIRLSAELDVARRLQLMVLPGEAELEGIGNLDVAAMMNPADEIGGDYYDCFRSGDSVRIGIGDVTGHGLSAGVVMLMAQTAVKTISLMGETDMKRSVSLVNEVLYSNMVRIKDDKSMTMSLIDYRDKTCTIAGQHESVIVCRADGTVQVEDTRELGMFLGLEPDISRFVRELRVPLAAGDVVVLYSDGVTEAMSDSGEEFGVGRLCDAAAAYRDQPSCSIIEGIVGRLRAHMGKARILDDISLFVAKQR